MNTVLIGVVVYILVQFAIGAFVSRKMASEDDYLLAGRRLGMFVGSLTILATWFGAESCIGAAGAIYSGGLSGGRADPFGYALCIAFMGLFFAAVFWKLRLTTIADLFRIRYGVSAEKIAVLLMVPTSLLWAAAQVRAFGQVLSASSNLDVSIAISVAAVVVIAYTAMGGQLADAITDVIQGFALIIGLVLVTALILLNPGDGVSLTEPLTLERMSFVRPNESFLSGIEAWAIPIMGSLFAQELVARTLAARSPGVARGACLLAGGAYVLIGLIPVSLGLVGPALLPGLEEPEQLLPALAQERLHTPAYIIFAGALVSAILSTVDSTLLACAALMSHNVIVPARPHATERFKVRAARIMVVLFGVVAYVMAFLAEGVYALVEEASALGSAGIFITVILGLLTTRGGPLCAASALFAGTATYLLAGYALELPYPYLASLAAALIAFLALLPFEQGEFAGLRELRLHTTD